jgi:hypothetical protein
MGSGEVARDADPPDACRSPAFTPQDHEIIGRWAEAIKGRGLRVETYCDLFGLFDEVLLVSPTSEDAASWLVHRTAGGSVAVRLWPGMAAIVDTLPEALSILAAAVGRAGA